MAWLSDSPISMVQCLEAAIQDERHRNIAQAGLAFARALSTYQVSRPQNPSARPELAEPQVPAFQPTNPVELVEQLAANVADAASDQETDGNDWPAPASTQPGATSGWDPNGLVPPPLPPEACRPPQQTEAIAQKSEPVLDLDTAACSIPDSHIPGSHAILPPLPPNEQFVPAAQPTPPQPVSQAAPQPVVSSQAPVWRAASSDWFTIDSGSDRAVSTSDRPIAPPATATCAEHPQPRAYGNEDAWSQPATSRTPFAVPPHPDSRVATETEPLSQSVSDEDSDESVDSPQLAPAFNSQSAAQQLDEELERRHVDVARETAVGNNDLQSADELSADSPAADFEPSQQMKPAPAVPSPDVSVEPWRPTVISRTMPAYESPALAPAPVCDSPAMPAAGAHGAVNSGPTFEGEPLKPAAHPRTVLVVDDSPTVRKLVAMTLEKNGYRVVSAYDGVAAIREIAEHNPALILMDVNMPRMDGYQLCKLVRKHEATRHIPVLMLSGKDGVFDRLRGKMVGCSGYVPKPFVPDELVQAVGEHIGVSGPLRK